MHSHWCGPCRGFTPKLAEAYAAYMKKAGGDAEAELVFVSWDQSADAFKEYHDEMPFPAIPFEGTEEMRQELGSEAAPPLVPHCNGVAQKREGELVRSQSVGGDVGVHLFCRAMQAFALRPHHCH